MSLALRFGSGARLRVPVQSGTESEAPAGPVAETQGQQWLGQRFAEQVERMCALLAETEPAWNIERHS